MPTHVHTHTHTHTLTYIHTQIHMHSDVHLQTHANTHTITHTKFKGPGNTSEKLHGINALQNFLRETNILGVWLYGSRYLLLVLKFTYATFQTQMCTYRCVYFKLHKDGKCLFKQLTTDSNVRNVWGVLVVKAIDVLHHS